MSVMRNRRKHHFTITPNESVRDPRLSLQAKGLLTEMLSYPDDWTYRLKHLEELSTNGRDSHRAALKELIEAGYAKWHYHHDGQRLHGRELIISDKPMGDQEAPPTGEKAAGRKTSRTENQPDSFSASTKTEGYEDLEEEQEQSSFSAKARSKTKPDTPSQSEAVRQLAEVWNEHRGTLPAANRVGGRRARQLFKMVKDLGLAEAKETLRKATIVVANDDFWKSKRFGLDNLLAGEKYVQRAEQYDAQQAEEKPPESVSLNVGDIVLARHSIGMRTVEMEGRVLEVGEKQIQVEFKRDEHTERVRIPYRDFIRRVKEAE